MGLAKFAYSKTYGFTSVGEFLVSRMDVAFDYILISEDALLMLFGYLGKRLVSAFDTYQVEITSYLWIHEDGLYFRDIRVGPYVRYLNLLMVCQFGNCLLVVEHMDNNAMVYLLLDTAYNLLGAISPCVKPSVEMARFVLMLPEFDFRDKRFV